MAKSKNTDVSGTGGSMDSNTVSLAIVKTNDQCNAKPLKTVIKRLKQQSPDNGEDAQKLLVVNKKHVTEKIQDTEPQKKVKKTLKEEISNSKGKVCETTSSETKSIGKANEKFNVGLKKALNIKSKKAISGNTPIIKDDNLVDMIRNATDTEMTSDVRDLILKYMICIHERYGDLLNAGKVHDTMDNHDLSKIFEYYSCIKLMLKHKRIFKIYDDIAPAFKEENNMSQSDTGIDCCDCVDTIVQCKLRKNYLNFGECSTFFANQNYFNEVTKRTEVRWPNLEIVRNADCKLSGNLKGKQAMFVDTALDRSEFLKFCSENHEKLPSQPKEDVIEFIKRDYQNECIDLITSSDENVIINLPTGAGKNVVIIYSMKKGSKYLILVPRVILLHQLHTEITKHRPELKRDIQTIGDGGNKYNEKKNITICVYNSISICKDYFDKYEKIFVDEAHHIATPDIYVNDDYDVKDNDVLIENGSNIDEIYDINTGDDEENSRNEEDEGGEGSAHDEGCDESADDEGDDVVEIDENDKVDEIYDSDEPVLLDDDYDHTEINNTKPKRIKKDNYINVIKNLKKYNNNIYLSATIDEMKGFKIYKKDIREMIDAGYLCDYQIKIPVFSGTASNKNICEYVIERYRHIIFYANSRREGLEINDIINQILPKSCEYIDCDTSKRQRDQILDRFKNGSLPYIVNVKVLTEGFNCPSIHGVCLMHMPSSKTRLIQIIGRCLRKHRQKIFGNIILPFTVDSDERDICDFLRVIAWNDSRIKKSYEMKKTGGYISINAMNEEIQVTDAEFRYERIYNSMNVLMTFTERFEHNTKLLFEYSSDNKKVPPLKLIYKGFNIGNFLGTQKSMIKIEGIEHNRYKILSENVYVKYSLDAFLKRTGRIKITDDDEKIKLISVYCELNKRIPNNGEKHDNHCVGYWYKEMRKKIIGGDDQLYIQLSQNEYIKKHLDAYLLKKKINMDAILLDYCESNKKVPRLRVKYKGVSIGTYYEKLRRKIRMNGGTENDIYMKITTNDAIKADMNEYLLKNHIPKVKIINERLALLIKYYEEYNTIPSDKVIYDGVRIGKWYQRRRSKIMTINDEAYTRLCQANFIRRDVERYLARNENERVSYDEMMNIFFEYCKNTKTVPINSIRYKNQNIGRWFHGQKKSIKDENSKKYIDLSKDPIVKRKLDEYLRKRNERNERNNGGYKDINDNDDNSDSDNDNDNDGDSESDNDNDD